MREIPFAESFTAHRLMAFNCCFYAIIITKESNQAKGTTMRDIHTTATGATVCPMRVNASEAREDAELHGLRYVVEFKSGYKAMRKPSNIGTVVMDLKASK